MNETERKFYKEVQESIIDSAVGAVLKIADATEGEYSDVKKAYEVLASLNLDEKSKQALQDVIRDSVETAVHSIFVSIDGGTALSDEGKALELVDLATGEPLTNGALHENFMDEL